MNPIKSFLALSAILCVSTLYAEENIYIKQHEIQENKVSSIVILGRDPSIIFSVSLGRYDFIDFCTSSSRQRSCSAVIDNRDSINSIMLSINELEFEQALPSSCNFYYKIVSKEEQIYFMNDDPLDVMMLLVLQLETGNNIPIWLDRFNVDIGAQRFRNSNELMKKLYNLLGYEY